jgi:hypothetical protein
VEGCLLLSDPKGEPNPLAAPFLGLWRHLPARKCGGKPLYRHDADRSLVLWFDQGSGTWAVGKASPGQLDLDVRISPCDLALRSRPVISPVVSQVRQHFLRLTHAPSGRLTGEITGESAHWSVYHRLRWVALRLVLEPADPASLGPPDVLRLKEVGGEGGGGSSSGAGSGAPGALDGRARGFLGLYALEGQVNSRPAWRHTEERDHWLAYSPAEDGERLLLFAQSAKKRAAGYVGRPAAADSANVRLMTNY